MIKKATFLQTRETNPYKNLALEEYLMTSCGEDECILYLWQNRKTVVIGRNQNCWKECDIKKLEKDGGYLVRRLSGGGAVYHDMGNLNFTFLVRRNNYDLDRQIEVIKQAACLLGIRAEKTGRNDITVDGMKFSGNAFYKTGDFCYHHGTLLVNADKAQMAEYLTVSAEKLRSKGVDSVPSRVGNLSEFCSGLTVDVLSAKLKEAFGMVYGLTVEDYALAEAAAGALHENQRKFMSWQWKYGQSGPFQKEIEQRFSWGDIQVQFDVKDGIIRSANVYSDAMDVEWVQSLGKSLTGCRYFSEDVCSLIGDFPEKIKRDLTAFFTDRI